MHATRTQTLAEWADSSPVAPRTHKDGAVWVGIGPLSEPKYWSLWMLSDYAVTSVTGGSVWLRPRAISNAQTL